MNNKTKNPTGCNIFLEMSTETTKNIFIEEADGSMDEEFERYVEEHKDDCDEEEIRMVDDEELNSIEKAFSEKETNRCEDSFRLFIRDIRMYPLLSQEEEIEFCKKMEAASFASLQLEEDPEMDSESKQLLRAVVLEGKQAKERMINSNLRLVISVAKRFINQKRELDNLVQDGSLGLIRAVEKFDYKKGYKFSTYATWWIRQAINRGLAEQERTIRIPVHMVELVNRIRRISREFLISEKREPSAKELSNILGIKEEKVKTAMDFSLDTKSLEASVNEEGDSSLEDFIADKNKTTEQLVTQKMLKEAVAECLEMLDEREKQVIAMRFGLGENDALTLEQVGERLHVTRERVRQIESKALFKLGHKACVRNKLQDFIM